MCLVRVMMSGLMLDHPGHTFALMTVKKHTADKGNFVNELLLLDLKWERSTVLPKSFSFSSLQKNLIATYA